MKAPSCKQISIAFTATLAVILIFTSYAISAKPLVGRVVEVIPSKHRIKVFDIFEKIEKEVIVTDTTGIEKDTLIRLWSNGKKAGVMRARKIERVKGHDITGMKRRLRKAIHSSRGRGGHRRRCRCR